MTKIQYLNKQIESTNNSLKHFKEKSEKFPDNKMFLANVRQREKELEILLEIKKDVKAWNIIKPYILLTDIPNEED